MQEGESKETGPDEGGATEAVANCRGPVRPPTNDFRYMLCGRQVEPEAGLWLNGPQIRVPDLATVLTYTDSQQRPTRPLLSQQQIDQLVARTRLASGDFPNSAKELGLQLQLLDALARDRAVEPYPAGRTYGPNGARHTVTPLSRFLQLQPPPFGTIFDADERLTVGIRPGEVNSQRERLDRVWPVINEGQELARAFEEETPGLYHRHALNWLLYRRPDISPPRHARIWMALDIAIYTALSAAWHFKWWNTAYSRLLRPSKYARRCRRRDFDVLYDRAVDDNGQEQQASPRPNTCGGGPNGFSPGTPRHPAWPSGHSTYSAAASHLVEYFVSPDTLWLSDDQLERRIQQTTPEYLDPAWLARELRRLANNIGEARLWAGVHWLDDHIAGQKIGRAAAEAVIEQFERDGVSPVNPNAPEVDPPAQAPPARPAPSLGQDTLRPAVPSPAEQADTMLLPPT